MAILLNHIGFERIGGKRAVIEAVAGLGEAPFEIANEAGEVVYRGVVEEVGAVDNWGQRRWHYYRAAFDSLEVAGRYRLRFGREPQETSSWFAIGDRLLLDSTLADCLSYFKAQRCSGAFDRKDRETRFFGGGRTDVVDVHGGWYDASGDTSKYLSHLSYANFLNPQQTPLLPWVFAQVAESLDGGDDPLDRTLQRRLRDEAAHGGDFLIRMQDPRGYFYMTVFDTWSKDLDAREICAYRTQQGHKSDQWQAGMRQGGGLAVAALAGLARTGVSGEFDSSRYLQAAIRGFSHLEEHNHEYLDDGVENIIDDYCGLVAATELYRATHDETHLHAARRRSLALSQRLTADDKFCGWWRSDDGTRPYFHAAEAGLPVVALCRYHDIETDVEAKQRTLETVRRSMAVELAVTSRVANPFGYARQVVRPVGGETRDGFFVPHDNESGYWWQGENARLSSLAAAARMAAERLGADSEFGSRLLVYASDQVDWILGRNPFDVCMLHGHGRNNPDYERGFPPTLGGICNGITSGFEDEGDVALAPENCRGRGDQAWRWGEQWLPHAAWYVFAVGCLGRRGT